MSKVIECLEQNIRKQIDNKKDYQIQSKWTDYKIFEFKYGNAKLLENTKHNQVKLVLAGFQLVGKITIDTFYLDKHLTIK